MIKQRCWLFEIRGLLVEDTLRDEMEEVLRAIGNVDEKYRWCIQQIQDNTKFSKLAYDYLLNSVWGFIRSQIHKQVAKVGLSYVPVELEDEALSIFNDSVRRFDVKYHSSFLNFLAVQLFQLSRVLQKSGVVNKISFSDRIKDLEDDDLDLEKVFREIVKDDELLSLVKRELKHLPDVQRRIMNWFLSGFNFVDISKKLNISPQTVYVHWQKAVDNLKDRLKVKSEWISVLNKLRGLYE